MAAVPGHGVYDSSTWSWCLRQLYLVMVSITAVPGHGVYDSCTMVMVSMTAVPGHGVYNSTAGGLAGSPGYPSYSARQRHLTFIQFIDLCNQRYRHGFTFFVACYRFSRFQSYL